MRYLINANFASHFAGAFLKTTLIYLTFIYRLYGTCSRLVLSATVTAYRSEETGLEEATTEEANAAVEKVLKEEQIFGVYCYL